MAAVRHFLSHFAYLFHLEGIDTFAVFGEKRGSFRVDAVVKAAVDRYKPVRWAHRVKIKSDFSQI